MEELKDNQRIIPLSKNKTSLQDPIQPSPDVTKHATSISQYILGIHNKLNVSKKEPNRKQQNKIASMELTFTEKAEANLCEIEKVERRLEIFKNRNKKATNIKIEKLINKNLVTTEPDSLNPTPIEANDDPIAMESARRIIIRDPDNFNKCCRDGQRPSPIERDKSQCSVELGLDQTEVKSKTRKSQNFILGKSQTLLCKPMLASKTYAEFSKSGNGPANVFKKPALKGHDNKPDLDESKSGAGLYKLSQCNKNKVLYQQFMKNRYEDFVSTPNCQLNSSLKNKNKANPVNLGNNTTGQDPEKDENIGMADYNDYITTYQNIDYSFINTIQFKFFECDNKTDYFENYTSGDYIELLKKAQEEQEKWLNISLSFVHILEQCAENFKTKLRNEKTMEQPDMMTQSLYPNMTTIKESDRIKDTKLNSSLNDIDKDNNNFMNKVKGQMTNTSNSPTKRAKVAFGQKNPAESSFNKWEIKLMNARKIESTENVIESQPCIDNIEQSLPLMKIVNTRTAQNMTMNCSSGFRNKMNNTEKKNDLYSSAYEMNNDDRVRQLKSITNNACAQPHNKLASDRKFTGRKNIGSAWTKSMSNLENGLRKVSATSQPADPDECTKQELMEMKKGQMQNKFDVVNRPRRVIGIFLFLIFC